MVRLFEYKKIAVCGSGNCYVEIGGCTGLVGEFDLIGASLGRPAGNGTGTFGGFDSISASSGRLVGNGTGTVGGFNLIRASLGRPVWFFVVLAFDGRSKWR